MRKTIFLLLLIVVGCTELCGLICLLFWPKKSRSDIVCRDTSPCISLRSSSGWCSAAAASLSPGTRACLAASRSVGCLTTSRRSPAVARGEKPPAERRPHHTYRTSTQVRFPSYSQETAPDFLKYPAIFLTFLLQCFKMKPLYLGKASIAAKMRNRPDICAARAAQMFFTSGWEST